MNTTIESAVDVSMRAQRNYDLSQTFLINSKVYFEEEVEDTTGAGADREASIGAGGVVFSCIDSSM